MQNSAIAKITITKAWILHWSAFGQQTLYENSSKKHNFLFEDLCHLHNSNFYFELIRILLRLFGWQLILVVLWFFFEQNKYFHFEILPKRTATILDGISLKYIFCFYHGWWLRAKKDFLNPLNPERIARQFVFNRKMAKDIRESR